MNEETKKILEYYYKNNVEVHIEKNNARFYNGTILELQGDMLILEDRFLGALPIFISEIRIMERKKDD